MYALGLSKVAVTNEQGEEVDVTSLKYSVDKRNKSGNRKWIPGRIRD